MAITFQFFMSLSLLVYFLVTNKYGPAGELNKKLQHMDVVAERENLANVDAVIRVKNDAYSLLYRALHELSAERMNLS